MTASDLMRTLEERGIRLEVCEGRLRYHPASALSPKLRESLIEHKVGVLALLKTEDNEIAWRVAAMTQQIPNKGVLPFLVARQGVESKAGCCLSCGDPLKQGDACRCSACGRAANLALELSMYRAKADRKDANELN
jgi:TubC N-terminal docking domain